MNDTTDQISRGTTREHGYKIEARDRNFNCVAPLVLHDGILGPDWRIIRTEHSSNPAGIPDGLCSHGHEHGLLSHEGALALAWTLVAQHPWRSIEVRLAQYSLETTYKCEPRGVVAMQPIAVQPFRAVQLVAKPTPTEP